VFIGAPELGRTEESRVRKPDPFARTARGRAVLRDAEIVWLVSASRVTRRSP